MFIFDFVAETVLDQIIDWLYGKIIGFLNDFFVMMNNMGVELFDLPWVEAVTTFFGYFGWALFGVGLVVGAFECAIEYQGGRGSIKDTAMNYIKGFMAVNLFTIVPVNLYSLCVSLQGTFGSAITGIIDTESIGLTAQQVLMSASFPGVGNPILQIFCAIMMGYAVIKVFFANLKRGGILLIQIAVGSLYMFSVPRGYIDGFIQWCKQVIGICMTAFLQSTILTAGLMVFKDHPQLPVVLVTAYMNYALDGYKVKASRFLLKDNLADTIEECMDDLIAEINKNRRILEFRFVEGTIKLYADDIIYIETELHKNVFYTEKGTFQIYKKLDELENELKNMGFVRAHLSFLVNMKYITQISSYVMTLTTGKKIPVPKARYAQVKREYMLYKGEE